MLGQRDSRFAGEHARKPPIDHLPDAHDATASLVDPDDPVVDCALAFLDYLKSLYAIPAYSHLRLNDPPRIGHFFQSSSMLPSRLARFPS
jgi:hypothetical protein